ncbi:FtsX-like permease family protein [Microbacterium sp. ZW T5_45]|uniref:FtsX-like permease family protein n=1 Tax=Microbacterium sp. ZW T5_45 TaxID=3378080 RepID=UPI0038521D6C
MNLRTLALLLRPGRADRAIIALPVAAFTIVTALVLIVVGGAQSFWTWSDDTAPLYQALAAIALALLLVPLASLGGAAARLSARRRDERLSTLRLLGVSPAGVGLVTVIESAVLAAIGTLAGTATYLAVAPLVGLIPFRGEALGLDGVLLSPALIAAVVGGVLAVAVGSAVLGLRRVVISPLGVRMRSTASSVHWVRIVIGVVVIGAAYLLIQLIPQIAGLVTTIVVLALLFGAAIGVLNFVGPWALAVSARRRLRRAQTPERMLSARLVLDAPKAAWRQVGGVAMASFMAVFAGTGVSLMNTLGAAEPGSVDAMIPQDMRTGLVITLVATFLMVAASVGVNQASAILDQRELHRSLHYLGVPVETVDSARRQAIMSPLLLTSLGSALCAAVLVFPLLGIALIVSPDSLLTIVLVVGAGIGTVWLSTKVTGPLLESSFRAA